LSGTAGRPKRFAFLVHPLVPWARRIAGLRTARPALVVGASEGAPHEVAELARVGVGDIQGVVMGIPWLPHQLLADQEGALRMMLRAVQLAAPVDFVGLGSVLAVVASRGVALQEACGVPVTTGNAATAWTASEVVLRLVAGRSDAPVAVLGGRGAVGRAIAERLRGRGLSVELDPEPAQVARFRWVVGASTTGGILAPDALAPGTTLVDVALPPTLMGPPPRGVRVVAGESLSLPSDWTRDGWGHLFHVVAGYGHASVYACLTEPLLALRTGRRTPFAQGRRVLADDVEAFGAAATAAGFVPEVRLA
jgi:predicted amino acid dehydrogenase